MAYRTQTRTGTECWRLFLSKCLSPSAWHLTKLVAMETKYKQNPSLTSYITLFQVGVPMSSFGAAGGGTYILEKHKTSHAIDCHQLGIWHSEKMIWSTFLPIMSVVLLEPHLVLCHPLTSSGTVNMKQDASSDRHNRINGVVRNRRHSR